METGHAAITELAATAYLAHCGATAKEAAAVLKLAKDTEDGYLVRRDVLRNLVLHETTAARVSATAPLLVPGLLQTEDYARAVMRSPEQYTEDQIDSMVAIRMGRQELLTRAPRPEFTYFIYEAALHSPIGNNRVMNEQMLHLAFMTSHPGMQIRIVPVRQGSRAACANQFTLMDFANHGPVLYVENPFAGMFVENAEAIASASNYLDKLASDALDGGQSRELIAYMANEYDRAPEGATCPDPGSPP